MKVIIANNHVEARRYCSEHDLNPRKVLTLTPSCCANRINGYSINADDVVNICRVDEMSDRQFEMYMAMMEDVDRAILRGGPR